MHFLFWPDLLCWWRHFVRYPSLTSIYVFQVLRFKNILPLMQLYATERYLYVPRQGSPKTPLLAFNWQLLCLLQSCRTFAREILEWQFRFLIKLLPLLHIAVDCRPYDADTMYMPLPAGQVIRLCCPSHNVAWFRLTIRIIVDILLI